jgi:hypothetical protein
MTGEDAHFTIKKAQSVHHERPRDNRQTLCLLASVHITMENPPAVQNHDLKPDNTRTITLHDRVVTKNRPDLIMDINGSYIPEKSRVTVNDRTEAAENFGGMESSNVLHHHLHPHRLAGHSDADLAKGC